MSVESEILRIRYNIANAYAAVAGKGGEVPAQTTSANLSGAVESISTGISEERLQEALSDRQNLLTGRPGQAVGFGADGAAAAVPGWSNPNLLDNWYFTDPVNQRGKEEYTSAGYTIDQWKLWSTDENIGTVFIARDGVILNAAESGTTVIEQIVEASDGEIMTLSILVSEMTGGFIIQLNESNSQYFAEPGLASVTGTMHDSVRIFNGIDGKTCKIKAVKLELGPVQTLARQDESGNWVLNDPPPDKALELAKCQRYYQVFSNETLRPSKAMDFRPPMRVDPALGTINIGETTYYTADASL